MQYIAEILTHSITLLSQVLSYKQAYSVLASKQPMESSKLYIDCSSNRFN